MKEVAFLVLRMPTRAEGIHPEMANKLNVYVNNGWSVVSHSQNDGSYYSFVLEREKK